MSSRSQRHLREVQGVDAGGNIGPQYQLTFAPMAATSVAAVAIGTVLATLTGSGGVAPYTFTLVNGGGANVTIVGAQLRAGANPIAAVGVYTVTIKVDDSSNIPAKDVAFTLTLT